MSRSSSLRITTQGTIRKDTHSTNGFSRCFKLHSAKSLRFMIWIQIDVCTNNIAWCAGKQNVSSHDVICFHIFYKIIELRHAYGCAKNVYFAGNFLLISFAITRHVMNVKRRQTLITALKERISRETPCWHLQLSYKSNKPHFLGVYQRNKPTWDVRRTQERLSILVTCKPFLVFS